MKGFFISFIFAEALGKWKRGNIRTEERLKTGCKSIGAALFNGGESIGTDWTIKIGPDSIKVHRFILKYASPFFAKLFEEENSSMTSDTWNPALMFTSHPELALLYDYELLKAALHFLYSHEHPYFSPKFPDQRHQQYLRILDMLCASAIEKK